MNPFDILFSRGRSGIAVSLLIATSIFMTAASQAQADPVVKLGTYNIPAGQANFPIQIFAYNDPSSGIYSTVQGIDLNIAIHDNTGFAPGPGGPTFTAGTAGEGNPTNSAYVGGTKLNAAPPLLNGAIGGDVLTGTIFGAFSFHTTPVDGGLSTSQGINDLTVNTEGTLLFLGTPSSPSLVATVHVSTIGVAPGTHWVLTIGGYQNGDPGPDQGPLDFTDGGLFNTVLTDGTINVVPEPASAVLAALGLIGLAAWGWRRRKA